MIISDKSLYVTKLQNHFSKQSNKAARGRMMSLRTSFCLLPLCFVLLSFLNMTGLTVYVGANEYNRHDFPQGFIFGSGTSAYQVEGAAFEDGRKASIFDTFTHNNGASGETGDVAADGYHKYKEDVQLMVETGLDAYRFSISWSRLIPNGRGQVNPKGLQYYNNLINELVRHGIQPHVTLVHFDFPQVLEDEYGGFTNRKIIEDFTAYADVCFREFGDRVLHWTTINEANMFIWSGYDSGNSPPSRCSLPFGVNCTRGNSSTEPYVVAHNMLLAHASAVKLYREKYQAKQHGFLGFSLYSDHPIPQSDRREDIVAVQRYDDFFIGWFMLPLLHGDYPEIMKRIVGHRLPFFTKNEAKLVKGSYDFIGLNYYAIIMVKDNSKMLMTEPRDYNTDMACVLTYYDGRFHPEGGSFPVAPLGLQGVLEHFKQAYGNPPIFILENGHVTDSSTQINDSTRVEYLQAIIGSLLEAVRNGSNSKGYFAWSFLDMFELLYGYKRHFGIYFVDFNDPDLTRYPKLSQNWYSGFLKGKNVTTEGETNLLKGNPKDFQIPGVDYMTF